MARHILAMANSGGGAIAVGVAETKAGGLDPVGLEKATDKAELSNTFRKFLPALLPYEVVDFVYKDEVGGPLAGKVFQVLFIFIEGPAESLPFICTASSKKTRAGALYVRKGTSSEEPDYAAVQRLINQRVETGYSSSRRNDLVQALD